jgi:hypothetical protein
VLRGWLAARRDAVPEVLFRVFGAELIAKGIAPLI